MTNSRKLFIGGHPLERREAVDRHAIGAELLDLLLDPDQVVLDGGGLGILAEDARAARSASICGEVDAPARARCGRAARGSPRRRTAGSARRLLAPAARNSVVSRVLPVPVGPETRITESRKKPPPHIASSSALPEVMRASDDFCFSSSAESGITTIPSSGTIVNGHSPFWWVVPRNLRISTVRRRTSSWSVLRRMMTLSETNSSTPYRETCAVLLQALGGDDGRDAHPLERRGDPEQLVADGRVVVELGEDAAQRIERDPRWRRSSAPRARSGPAAPRGRSCRPPRSARPAAARRRRTPTATRPPRRAMSQPNALHVAADVLGRLLERHEDAVLAGLADPRGQELRRRRSSWRCRRCPRSA